MCNNVKTTACGTAETFNFRSNLLPSATKLRRLCFHRRVSVQRGVYMVPVGVHGRGGCLLGGCAWSRSGVGWCIVPGGVSAPGGQWCMVRRVCAWSRGVHAPRGGVFPSMHWGRPHPGETATVAGSTHPTGMHSCLATKFTHVLKIYNSILYLYHPFVHLFGLSKSMSLVCPSIWHKTQNFCPIPLQR